MARYVDAGEPLIRVEHVDKRFGETQAVNDVSFDVQPGSIFGLIGPSGSGKSTIIRLLCGIHQPTSGTIRVFHEDPFRLGSLLRGRLGYMPQLFVLYPNLTVEQ